MQLRLQISLACAGLTAFVGSGEAQQLPVPCLSCAGGPGTFVTSGQANYVVSGTTGTITQGSERAILNWQSFNIGAGNTVNFVQPSSSSAALNRIFQNDPSVILGALNANGQVFLINQNGIIFGQGAQVNTSALTASTLNLSDDIFNHIGLAGAASQQRAAFEGGSDPDAAIQVLEGATLKSDQRILIIAPNIVNRGRIETPGGQTILAASEDRVYLTSNQDLRGFLVEVATGGSVENLGQIVAERGNVTLAGLAVNQSGRISATTSTSLNGSIHLLARDGASIGATGAVASRTGTLTFGQSSITEVLPDASTDTAVDGQTQQLSRILGMGRTVELQSGARVVSSGGEVNLQATTQPANPGNGVDAGAKIYLASGSVIDVSGDDTAQVAMERNQGRIKLFGNELADAPVQRDGALARQEIAVDLREGTGITDISRLRGEIKRSVGERLSAGGTVTLGAEGDVVIESGSVVDFSGGQVRYLDGYLETSKLVTFDGRIVDIGEADPNLPYAGFYGGTQVRHQKWGVTETFRSLGSGEFHRGYVEGKDAGSLTIASGGGVALNGTLRGESLVGDLQRNPASSGAVGVQRAYTEIPLGGLLSITAGKVGVSSRDLIFSNARGTDSYAFDDAIPTDRPVIVSTQQLNEGGITRVRASAPLGQALLPEDVEVALAAGGELSITGNTVRVEGDISVPSGDVRIASLLDGAQLGSITIAGSADIDVRGTWVNDLPSVNAGAAGSAPLFIDGGTVTVSSRGDLTLEQGSVIDVSAGAHVQADGALATGGAGTIKLASTLPDNVATTLDLQGELRGYGFDRGGTLQLSAASFRIGDASSDAPQVLGQVSLAPSFFQSGGFSNYEVIADRGDVLVAEGTQVHVTPLSMQLVGQHQFRPTGADLLGFTELTLLPEFMRSPTSFSAVVDRATGVTDAQAVVRIADNASIVTEAGGTISLASDTDIFVNGTLRTPGGNIELSLANPSFANERGYRADQGIWLDSQARLDARGTAQVITDQFGIRSGEILAGGSVSLQADRGYIVSRAGSVIDVSGTQQVFDLPGPSFDRLVPTEVAGDAGSVSVRTAEGALLFGEMRAAAGGAGAAGGTLNVVLNEGTRDGNGVGTNPVFSNLPQFIIAPREILIVDNRDGDIALGTSVPSFLNGQTVVAADRVRSAGFDAIDLTVQPYNTNRQATGQTASGIIRFDGEVALTANRRISLAAGVIEGDDALASVRAPLVSIGLSSPNRPATAATPVAGSGQLRVDADHIDLRGDTVFSGFATGGEQPAIALASRGDIRMIGDRLTAEVSTPRRNNVGSIASLADISLSAAQIYPATLTEFSINVTGQGGRIVVDDGGAPSAQTPLSAAGVLKLSAAQIVQGGVLRAPFGTIELAASERLELTAGSITSTSGRGAVVPFGTIELGEDWVYPIGNGPGSITSIRELLAVPEKNVILDAPEVSLAVGSTVDISGGGDLLTYEFVPGPGGSRDILLGDNAQGSFAIVPGLGTAFGVFDPYESPSAGIETGRTITIGEGSSVPAGEYTILPARYALLPGAYLIRPAADVGNIQPSSGQVLVDGVTPVVAGRLGYAGTDIKDARWSGYAVLDGTQVRQRSEYNVHLASRFFTDGAGIPADAGRLTIDAERSIRIDGTLAATAASGGKAAQVDFVADNIAVVATRTGTTDRTELVASELQNFAAASLLLGGSRRNAEDSIELQVSAQGLTIESGANLSAAEIILAATDTVTVAQGATVRGTGTASDGESETIYSVSGDGAVARVAAGAQATIERESAGGLAGRVVVEEGATLAADGSINLEASRDVISAGDLLTSGGSLSLTASLISLGDAPSATSGLVLTNSDLARFEAGELLLNSRGTIDFYGTVVVDLNRVGLDSRGLRGFANGGVASVTIDADEVSLSNTTGAAPSSLGTGGGTLALSAATISLDSGNFDISGFNTTRLTATRELVGNERSGLRARGDLEIATPRLTGGAGSDVTLSADGALTTTALTAPADLGAVTALGARMTLTGASIAHGGRIETPSGIVTLRSTGANGISLAAGSVIDVSGRDVDLRAATVGSPGGIVSLIADQDAARIGADATVDVSGADSGGDAGRLSILAAGAAQIASGAHLRGNAIASETQGTFELTAGSLSNGFSGLNSSLNSGGFNERRALTLQTGSVTIGAGDTVNAREFELAVEGGSIDVAGRINAAARDGGYVRLSARDDVTLRGSARIDARATGAGEQGGTVELATRSGNLIIQATDSAQAATINVSGTEADGSVRLRAPRVGTDSVAITALAGRITGAERIEIEAFRSYAATSIDGALIGTIEADTAAYMANAAAIKTTLGVADDARFHFRPGVEIESTGDLALNSAWDLMNWRYDGEAGVLTLRAAGNLSINQSLSDGFAFQSIEPFFTPERDVVQTDDSWSYRLVAGARSNAADALGVRHGTGTATVGDNVFVRTGTGDIDVATGDDFVLSTAASAIYTVGENRGTGVLHPTDAEVVLRGDFVENGGDIRIRAGGDVRGVSDQLMPNWLARVAGEYPFYLDARQSNVFPAAWAIDSAKFVQGVGALGGGDVQISAGGNLDSLTVALPTNGQPNAMDGSQLSVAGGGDLSIDVAGDILGGIYMVGRGEASIRSGGAITTGATGNLLPILQLGDAQISVQARTGVGIQTVFNPTVALQDDTQGLPDLYLFAKPDSYFFTYGERSAVELLTIAGNTNLRATTDSFSTVGTPANAYMKIYPGSLAAHSLQGDVLVNDDINLFPSPEGDLSLLAGGNIVSSALFTVNLSDADVNRLPGLANPTLILDDATAVLDVLKGHAQTPVHALDDAPVLIGAVGTIGSDESLRIETAKQARVFAGEDVANLSLFVQHAREQDVTIVSADRDITYPITRNLSGRFNVNNGIVSVAGPGRADLLAGRNVNFGVAAGVETVGNQRNPALADTGAEISIWTGQSTRPDYAAFIERYFEDSTNYSARLREYLAKFTSNPSLSDVENFRALPEYQQRDLIQEVFFAEIRKSDASNYQPGFDVIATLFPAGEPEQNRYEGDLTSYLSHIRTVDGGDINLMVPNGSVNAGLSSSGSISKPASQLGIIAQRFGAINAFANSDFLVNASRVFSLDGGDIVVWSSEGDIDAGRGSRAALAIPPPLVTLDAEGNVVVEFPPAVSGSGIRTAVSTPGRQPGNAFLFAPKGAVISGDAGIDIAGNLIIAAAEVIGADNINVGGLSVGVPVDTGGLGASLSGVSSVASSAASSVDAKVSSGAAGDEPAAALADSALSWLDVFVVGLGEDACRQDDMECLKRQRKDE